MSARASQRSVPCGTSDARGRLVDARAFLDVAEVSDNTDVIATNAIHAAIAAADVLCCLALGKRSSSANNSDAVEPLHQVDATAANSLRRCLDLKTKAAYETRDLSAKDAAATVRHATHLVEAAEKALLAAP